MENLIEAIRTALRDDAEPIARRAGMMACRKILAVLETATLETATDEEPTAAATAAPSSTAAVMPPSEATGAPSSAATAAPSSTAAMPPSEATGAPSSAPSAGHVAPPVQMPAPGIDPAAVATLVASLGKLPPEQLLDLAIARLRAALPAGVSVPAPSTPLRFQIVPIHHLGNPK
jgi:hypothetical protein